MRSFSDLPLVSQIDVGPLYTEYTRLCLLNLKAEKNLKNPFSLDVMSPLNTGLAYEKNKQFVLLILNDKS